MSALRPPCACIKPIELISTFPHPLRMNSTSSNTIDLERGTYFRNHKSEDAQIPEIPSHWVFGGGGDSSKHFCWRPFTHFLHHLFCVIGLGHASLHSVWKDSYPGCPDEVWEKGRDRLRERLEHINIVVRSHLRVDECFACLHPSDWSRLVYSFLQ